MLQTSVQTIPPCGVCTLRCAYEYRCIKHHAEPIKRVKDGWAHKRVYEGVFVRDSNVPAGWLFLPDMNSPQDGNIERVSQHAVQGPARRGAEQGDGRVECAWLYNIRKLVRITVLF